MFGECLPARLSAPGRSSTIRAVCLGEQIKSESLEETMKTKEDWHLLCVSTLDQSVELDVFKCDILLSVLTNAMKLVCLVLWFVSLLKKQNL